MAPAPMSKALFTCSGSEANDTAIKLVRYYHHAIGKPDKHKVISRLRAYHGVTPACASLSGLPHVHRDFGPRRPGILHTECPHHYRYALPGETEEAFATRLAAELERLILREGPGYGRGFIAEPIMGAGGVIMPPAGYFRQIQAVLEKYDVLLIADEVITGFGRTGEMFGCARYGIRPDLVLAKGLSAGYLPIGAVLIAEPIYRAMLEQSRKIGTFGHGFTYSGHPACAAAALRALEIYEEDRVLEQCDHRAAFRRAHHGPDRPSPGRPWPRRRSGRGDRADGRPGAKTAFEPALKVARAWSSTRSNMASFYGRSATSSRSARR